MAVSRDLALALDPALVMVQAGMQPDPWQAALLRSRAQRALLLCTRQAGKSTVTAAVALYEALYHAPALVLLLSPSLRQSSELFRKVAGFYQSFAGSVPADSETVLRLELANGSRILSLPGAEATVRGFSSVSLLIIDEAARVPDDLYYSVRPMMAVSGGRLIALSTPWGKTGWFFNTWEKGQGWDRTKITAYDCPRISPDFLAEERQNMPAAWFAAEYLCQFNELQGGVFTHEQVEAAVKAGAGVEPLFGGGRIWGSSI